MQSGAALMANTMAQKTAATKTSAKQPYVTNGVPIRDRRMLSSG